METKLLNFKNGLPVIFIKDEHNPLAYAYFMVNAGAKDEKKSTAGLAHAVEHFLFTGSQNYSKKDLLGIPSWFGSSLEGYTDLDFTSFGFRVLKEHCEPMLQMMTDMLIRPQFLDVAIKEEIKVILTEMAVSDDDEDEQLASELHSCFGIDKQQALVFGTKESVSHLTAVDARKFWETYYTAGNSVLCLYGNGSMLDMAEKYFEPMRSGYKSTSAVLSFSANPYRISRGGSDVQLTLIFPEEKRFSAADEILAMVIGNTYSSRLCSKLRSELSLVYAVSANIDSYACGDIFYITTSCLHKNLLAVVDVVCQEIVRIRENGITEDELKCAYNNLKTELWELHENPSDLIVEYCEDFLLGRFIPIEDKLKLFNQVTVAEVNASAQRIFAQKPSFGVIGNPKSFPNYAYLLNRLKM